MAISVNERQKRYQAKKRRERLLMPHIPCACGCNTLIPRINSIGEKARFALGHNSKFEDTGGRFQKGQKPWNYGTAKPPKPKETREEMIERCRKMARERNFTGSNNPFYGKHHSEETKRILSEKSSGANNAGWAGGIATLPYGVGFTRKFKRLIRERDGNMCQRCGKPREQNWRALEIHHIDHDKMNNDPTNLITVCSSCNVWLSYHREEALTLFPKRRMLLH